MPAVRTRPTPPHQAAPPLTPPPTAGHFAWLALALLLLTVYGSIIPLRYTPTPLGEALRRLREAPLIDFAQIGFWGDWAVNLVQYALLAFFAVACLSADRRWGAGLAAALLVVPACCAVAVGTELLQVSFPPRTVSRNDLVVEGLGALAGAAAWLLAGQGLVNHARALLAQRRLAGLAAHALPAYVALMVVLAAIPFDLIFGWEELDVKLREGRVNLAPFAHIARDPTTVVNTGKTLAAFALLGALMALSPRWAGRRWPTPLAAGVAVAGLVELLQLAMFTRSFDVTDLLLAPVGAVLGYAFAGRLADADPGAWGLGPAACAALVAGWAVVLVAVNWQPYHFSTDPADFLQSDPNLSDENTLVVGVRRISWGPFVDYYWNSRYQALDQMIRRSASFAPLGGLLALAFRRRHRLGAAVTLLLALLVAAMIEGGQYFIPQRHPGVTDFLIQVAAACGAYWATRHVLSALAPDGARPPDAPWPPEEEVAPQEGEVAPAVLWHSALGLAPAHAPRLRHHRRPRPPADPLLRLFDALPYWAGAVIIGLAGLALLAAALLLIRLVD